MEKDIAIEEKIATFVSDWFDVQASGACQQTHRSILRDGRGKLKAALERPGCSTSAAGHRDRQPVGKCCYLSTSDEIAPSG